MTALDDGDLVALGPDTALLADASGDRLVPVAMTTAGPGDCRVTPGSPISLTPGDRPHRIAVDDAGTSAFVTLPGAGSVARVGLDAPAVLRRRSLCPEPLGVALAPDGSSVAVACGTGELFLLDPSTLEEQQRVLTEPGLREALFTDDGTLWVLRQQGAQVEMRDPKTLALRRSLAPPVFVEGRTQRRLPPGSEGDSESSREAAASPSSTSGPCST